MHSRHLANAFSTTAPIGQPHDVTDAYAFIPPASDLAAYYSHGIPTASDHKRHASYADAANYVGTLAGSCSIVLPVCYHAGGDTVTVINFSAGAI